MKDVNITIMGKTGAGKSTLINSIVGEKVAPTGLGQPITKENKEYYKLYTYKKDDGSLYGVHLTLYDTVGLEIDNDITQKTIEEIKTHLQECNKRNAEDISVVWFCINDRSHRLEDYEEKLINQLSINKEVPFLLILTQCAEEKSELSSEIGEFITSIPCRRVLAEDMETRMGTIKAFGVKEAIQYTVEHYNDLKISLLETKKEELEKSIIKQSDDKERLLAEMEKKCNSCIANYSIEAGKLIGGPVTMIKAHALKREMWKGLFSITGIHVPLDLSEAIFDLFTTPFMVLPGLGKLAAESFIETSGNSLKDLLLRILEQSTKEELQNEQLMAERIEAEIKRRKIQNG